MCFTRRPETPSTRNECCSDRSRRQSSDRRCRGSTCEERRSCRAALRARHAADGAPIPHVHAACSGSSARNSPGNAQETPRASVAPRILIFCFCGFPFNLNSISKSDKSIQIITKFSLSNIQKRLFHHF